MLVGVRVEGLDTFAGRIVGDDGCRAPVDQEAAQLIGVIGGVGQAQARAGQGFEQGPGEGSVAPLSGGYFEGDEAAFAIDNRVDFGRATAARATDRLDFGPLFRPPPSDGP